MLYNYSIVSKEPKQHLDDFLDKNFFKIATLEEISKSKARALVILPHDTEKKYFYTQLELINRLEQNIFLMMTNKINIEISNPKPKRILYPLDILAFDKIFSKKIHDEKLSFKDVYLFQDSYLCNKFNQKKIYLTETEISIIKLLFKDRVVTKNELKTDILDKKINMITKSLESHLSRIRKKINDIDSSVLITSINKDSISIL